MAAVVGGQPLHVIQELKRRESGIVVGRMMNHQRQLHANIRGADMGNAQSVGRRSIIDARKHEHRGARQAACFPMFCLARSTMASKAVGSWIANSLSILRSRMMFATRRPKMKRLY